MIEEFSIFERNKVPLEIKLAAITMLYSLLELQKGCIGVERWKIECSIVGRELQGCS